MNRILQAFLIASILTTPAYSQKPDSLDLSPGVPDTLHAAREPDTLHAAREPDTLHAAREPDTLHAAREPDTLQAVQGADTTLHPDRKAMRSQADSVKLAEPDFSHSPSKATMYALVLPGLGQVYNKKYYKIPIVWAALGVAGYAITYNTRNYRQASLDYALVPDDTNERYLQFWRRNLELSYIGLLAVYALQVLDAYVDAQLYSWDVNDNLSLRVAPSLQPLLAPAGNGGQAYGLTCSLNLKRR
jgi:hypothetical protein